MSETVEQFLARIGVAPIPGIGAPEPPVIPDAAITPPKPDNFDVPRGVLSSEDAKDPRKYRAAKAKGGGQLPIVLDPVEEPPPANTLILKRGISAAAYRKARDYAASHGLDWRFETYVEGA